MNQELYQIISGGGYLTHSIGKVTNKQTFMKLSSILSLGGLYSKERLNKMLNYQVEGMVRGNGRITKECYVSLFDAASPSLEKRMRSPKFNTFPLDSNEIFFMVDPAILHENNSKRSDTSWHEVVVKNVVPMSFFRGMVVPNSLKTNTEFQKLMTQFELSFPIYDFDGNMLEMKKGFGK